MRNMDTSQTDYDEVLGEEEAIIEEEFEPSFPVDILKLEHSFGYNCKRLFNLVLLDDDTLLFASGNYLHYFSIPKGEVTFRESTFGCGIGFITKNVHPDYYKLFTVGENGPTPTVYIYEWPSHNVRYKLLNAAKASFTAGSYNSSGELFASQAGYPDFMLTIWNWQKEEVVLRSKSFQNDILFVHFSIFNPILLVTSGLSHIKFWKMANTFTGLKLKGDLGRFGKTDFSDIYSIYMLSDENVLSGCEWGNILLWEAGLIKFEICRKGRKPCHTKPITSITMKDGEVTTVGMDGYVRVWYWETVDLADPPEDDLFVEIDPIYEFKIADVEIRAIQKINAFDENDFTYYAQDGKGGIWFYDINMFDEPKQPYQLYSCIGGRVIAAETSPISPHLLTLSEDGKIFAYNYETRTLLLEKQFNANGVDLLWFSAQVSTTCMELIAGFEDGIVRQLFLDLSNSNSPTIHLVRAIKAHTAPITGLTVNTENSLLVTAAADKSIFIYSLLEKSAGLIYLTPIGFVQLAAIPNCFYWHDINPTTILIGCKSGEVYEYDIRADFTEEDTYLTYNITEKKRLKTTRFVSVKSRIRRDIKREKIKRRKDKKRQRKMVEIEKLKKANPGLQIDMETALADSEPDEEEEPLHIPIIPNSVLWIRYTERDTIWVSMAGFDAGYIYELEFGVPEPSICTMIANGDDIEIHSYLLINEYMIFGLINGRLRVNRLNLENFTDLSEFRLYPMHDTQKGVIPRILSTYNGQHIVSIGYDGNVFLYKWNGPKVVKNELVQKFSSLPTYELSEDIIELEYPSLEQEKINAEMKRQEEAAAAHDRDVLEKIGKLQLEYFEIIKLNEELPIELRATDRELLFDERITKQIRNELQAELDDVREDLAYDLEYAQVGHQKLYNHFLKELDHVPFCIESIWGNITLHTFRLQALGEEHEQIKRDIEERLQQEKILGLQELIPPEEQEFAPGEPPIEVFFFGRDPQSIVPRFSRKMMRLLNRYRKRQLYQVKRIFDWDKLERQKPDPNRNHPDDEAQILEAQRTLGDYKLKISPDYEPKSTDTLTYKYIEIVKCRERLFDLTNAFNQQLFEIRRNKKQLFDYISEKRERLAQIHDMLPEGCQLQLDYIENINMDKEYPELNLIEHYEPGCGVEIDDILYLEKTVEEAVSQKHPTTPAVKLKSKVRLDVNEEAKTLAMKISELDKMPPLNELLEEIKTMPQPTDAAYYEINESNFSPFLVEARYRWLLKLLIEQEHIIRELDQRIRNFDQELLMLQEKRYQTKMDIEFMASYMISLNQELYILRDSEEIETQLLLNANMAMNTRNELQMVINTTNRQMEDLKKSIEKLQEQISGLQIKFMNNVKGHKFFDFLRRIFKKKWRPPKPPKKDDESSESSSSDSSSSEDEETDTRSIDSLDMTTIRLEESTCPTGLERPLYELAFKMRSDRHGLERTLIETQREIENKHKEIVEMQKKMKYQEEVYERERNTLVDFRRQRQQEINKVEVNVVLRMDQLQHFYEGDDYRDLTKVVLFDANMLVNLRRRVEQLNEETLATKRWHRINIVHLRRMNTDVKFMRYEITRLEEQIRQAMMRKFGMVINLDELEEEVLRRYVFDLETTAEEELKALEKELRERQLELANCEEDVVRGTQTNAEKLNILSVLREEKSALRVILDLQEKHYVKWTKPQSFNTSIDIEKLLGIQRQQKQQIECLEREICTLRFKSKPLQIEEPESSGVEVQLTTELLPTDEPFVCPAILNEAAFTMPLMPDDFIMERIQTIVQKTFQRLIGNRTTPENIRKYSRRTALYMGQAAYNFDGKITDRIQQCISDHLQTIVPKKYFIYMSATDLRTLFNEVFAVLDYERSDVNTEDVISGIFEHAKDVLCAGLLEVTNRSHFILKQMFKELIEVLPLEEFQSEETLQTIVAVLEREPLVDPRSIGIEDIITATLQHANENLLDGITAVPVRKLITSIQKELLIRRHYKQPQCSGSSMSVSIHKKLGGNIF